MCESTADYIPQLRIAQHRRRIAESRTRKSRADYFLFVLCWLKVDFAGCARVPVKCFVIAGVAKQEFFYNQ